VPKKINKYFEAEKMSKERPVFDANIIIITCRYMNYESSEEIFIIFLEVCKV
jgi:hypothetical protein